MQILIIDDDRDMCLALCDLLKEEGHNTLTAYNGKNGLRTIDENQPDLIFLDYKLPDIDGIKVKEEIKKIDKNTIELDARVYINDLNDEFELNLPENEDYDTIGGFVFSHLGYIPKTAETFKYENLKFTIISAEARRIKRMRIQKSFT